MAPNVVYRGKSWQRAVLLLAGVYNLVWGAAVVLVPNAAFDWLGLVRPNYPQIWQCVGMIVGVYGIGYAIASTNPLRHWPIVLVGLLGKILGPIGFVQAAAAGTLPWAFGWTIITNDLIWWIPFALILRDAARAHRREGLPSALSPAEAMASVRIGGGAAAGRTLAELAEASPVLVVFLRHAGCTFCREALSDLRARRAEIERHARIAIVHMGDDASAASFFAKYGLDDVARISDPERTLYRAFDLGRGSLWQLFGPRVWVRGFRAGVLAGHGVGRLEGDGFQMPGTFLVHRGRIIRSHRHKDAADRPDYAEIACTLPAAG